MRTGLLLMLALMLCVAPLKAEETAAPAGATTAPAAADAAAATDLAASAKPEAPQHPLTRIQRTLDAGGPIMYVLLATSVIGLTFGLERLVSLRRNRHIPTGLVEEVSRKLERENVDAGRLLLKGNEAALARVLDGVLARRGATRQEREQVLEDEAGRVLWDLRHNIRPVGIVASVAPLLGLLGTVFGLIGAFQSAAELGMDDPRNFASGIYEALYTTAFGLTIAIPFLILYHLLRGKADVIMREVEDIAIGFIIDQDLAEAKPAEAAPAPVAAPAPASATHE